MPLEVRLSREMRLLDVTMIGVGAMIGAGIFVLTGIAAGVAGPGLLLAFALNGFVALLTAMAYAELGSAFHDAGGGYLWVKSSLPGPNGFLSGWMSWFAHAVACSLYALGFGAYFDEVLQQLGAPELPHLGFGLEKWLAVLACAAFAYINFRGASETGKAGNVVTVAKVLVIGIFVGTGLWALAHQAGWQGRFQPFLPFGWGGVFAAMGLTFIAFEGYEIIAQTSEEVEDPKRNVPRATFLSLAIVVPIYLFVAFVAIASVVPPPGESVYAFLGRYKELALVQAAEQFLRGGGVILLVGGLLSTLSALNATIYSSSRVAFAMARDANLPQPLAALHERRATPHVAIFFSALLIIVMALALPIEDVAAAADIMFLLLFVQVNVALIRLRKLRPDLERGFRVPLFPLTPLLAIASMLFLSAYLFLHYPMAWVAAGGWIVAGTLFYYGYARSREAALEARQAWMERIERKEYRVLVALAHPKTMTSLVEAGVAVARRYGGDLVLLSVVEVPEGVSLLAGRRRVRELEPLLEQAAAYADERGVRAYPVVKIARRVSHAIVETAREEACNFIVLGRAVRQSFFERLVSTVVDRVLADAPCQVGILYGTLARDGLREILLPVEPGVPVELPARMAQAFAQLYDLPIRPVLVLPSDLSRGAREERIEHARRALAEAGIVEDLQVAQRRDVVEGLARLARRDTLVVLGAPDSGPVAALFGEALTQRLAGPRRGPLLVVRDVEPKRARRFERVFFGAGGGR